MKNLKTRPTTAPKLLDKSTNLSTRMKNAAVKSKSAVESADRQAGQTQDAGTVHAYRQTA